MQVVSLLYVIKEIRIERIDGMPEYLRPHILLGWPIFRDLYTTIY